MNELAYRMIGAAPDLFRVSVVEDENEAVDYSGLNEELVERHRRGLWDFVGVLVVPIVDGVPLEDVCDASLWSVEWGQVTEDRTITMDTLVSDPYQSVIDPEDKVVHTYSVVDTLVAQCQDRLRWLRDELSKLDLD